MDLTGHIKKNHKRIEIPVRYSQAGAAVRAMVRAEYQKRQGNNCYYCGCDLDLDPPKEITRKPVSWRKFPRHFLSNKIHLHHCHKTDMTLGAVHAYCNAVLWQYHGE